MKVIESLKSLSCQLPGGDSFFVVLHINSPHVLPTSASSVPRHCAQSDREDVDAVKKNRYVEDVEDVEVQLNFTTSHLLKLMFSFAHQSHHSAERIIWWL